MSSMIPYASSFIHDEIIKPIVDKQLLRERVQFACICDDSPEVLYTTGLKPKSIEEFYVVYSDLNIEKGESGNDR